MITAKIKSIIYVLICVLFWSLIPVVSKLGQTNLDNHQFLFWSSLVSFCTFVLISKFQKKKLKFGKLLKKDWIHSIFLGFLGTYLYYILLYFGYANSKGIEVLVIQYCWPIFVIILSVTILKEKINLRKIISMALGFLGVFLVLSKGHIKEIHLDNIYVNILVLLAALAFGLFSVLSKKIKIDSLTLVSIYFLTATVVSFLSMLILSDFKLPTKTSIIPIIINGVIVNGISYIFWIKSLKLGKASFVAPFVFLTPVLSTFLLVIFFEESFKIIYLLGMTSVIIGGLINKDKR